MFLLQQLDSLIHDVAQSEQSQIWTLAKKQCGHQPLRSDLNSKIKQP